MGSPSQRASSTCNTGTLDETRVSPSFRRRVASSRPRRCGIETISGAGILVSLDHITACRCQSSPKKNNERTSVTTELFKLPFVFWSKGRATGADCRAGGDCHVSIGTIILIILVIALLGGFSGIGGGPFYGTGYYGGGGPGLVVCLLLILLLLGRL